MNLRNRVQLIGNLGANPSIREFEKGNKVAKFSIATTDIYKRDKEYIKDTQWHNIVAWGKNAEIAEKNLSVGSEVVIDGRLTQRSYIDKNGIKQYIYEIIAEIILCRSTTNKAEAIAC